MLQALALANRARSVMFQLSLLTTPKALIRLRFRTPLGTLARRHARLRRVAPPGLCPLLALAVTATGARPAARESGDP
jgi:hypothetical protein